MTPEQQELYIILGRIEGKLDVIAENAKLHGEQDHEFYAEINDKLSEYNEQLILHIARTEQVEAEIKKLEPLRKLSDWVGITLKIMAVITLVTGVLKIIDLPWF